MQITIIIDQTELKQLVMGELQRILGNVPLDEKKVQIETKSNQNYKSEWEGGAGFRATYITTT